ncbi:MAG: endolytic transglycosylase MltG [Bacteroidales bacterium]|nr:endolytic transglycosylase MltG [Bacteroidales bacterium]
MDKNKVKSKKTKLIITIAAALVLVIGAAVVCPYFFTTNDQPQTVYVYPNVSDSQNADSLKVHLDAAFADRLISLSKLRKLRPGAYTVEADASVYSTWRKMAAGEQTPVKLRLNNMRTIDDFVTKASSQLALNADEMRSAIDKTIAEGDFTEQTIPAMILPDTYEVYWTTSADNLLAKLRKNYDSFWDADRKAKADKIGLTPVEASTLASIVEEETSYAPEKGTVARLYLNRIKQGMKLQSDPTVKFAVGDRTLRRILHKHLVTESPYNTYIVYGLPPGPIRMPSKATIDAVLNAPENDYIFMCAKEDFSGSHNFTAGYAEHMQNARRYQAALDARNIK